MNNMDPIENPNTVIWDKICETDPGRTKKIEGKKYRGTSVNPNYIYEKLTSVFGPCGTGWGFEIKKELYREGHDLCVTHSYQIDFWYKSNGARSEMIPAVGCTDYVFKNKNGWNTDEDAPKKSLTDALTKASVMIGMSADIFGGLWDDCKYVAELKKKYTEEDTEPAGGASSVNKKEELISDAESIALRKVLQAKYSDVEDMKKFLKKHGFASSLKVTKEKLSAIMTEIEGLPDPKTEVMV